MAYDFLGKAIEAGRIAPAPAPAPRPTPMMFDFQPKQATQDNFMTKDEVRQALANVSDKRAGLQKLLDGGFKLEGYEEMKAPAPVPAEQGFGAGFAEKTAESFKGGISRIGEAGVGLAEGKYTFPEAAARGAAGSLQSFFSPVAGAIGQTFEQFTPESVKTGVAGAVAPIVQRGQEFYAGQSPEQQRALANIGVGGEVLLNFLGGGAVSKTVGSKAAKTVATEAGKTISEGGKAVGKGFAKTGEAIYSIPEYGISLATGLSKGAQQTIKSTPEIYKKARTGEITRETIFEETKSALDKRLSDLSELGKSYKDLRTGKVVGKSDDLQDAFNRATANTDIVDLPNADRNAIAEAKKYIDEIQGNLTDRQLLSMRKKIDSTISWDKGVSSEGQAVVRGIRASIDDLAKSKIPGLAERDIKFAPEIKFLNTVKNTIYNAKGEIKDNALSAINNLTGKGKEFKIERFEKILPGITEKINALKAFEEVQGISEIKTGSIFRQGGGIIAGTTTGGPLGAFVGFVLTHPGIAARVLETYGMSKIAIKGLFEKVPKKDSIEKALQIFKQAKKPDVEKVILNTKTTQPLKKDPLKDIAFINKVSKGEVQGLSKEALDAMQGVKTVKEAMQKAKSAGVEDEIVAIYPKVNVKTQVSKPSIKEIVSENTPSKITSGKKDLIIEKKNATIEPIAPKTKNMTNGKDLSNIERPMILKLEEKNPGYINKSIELTESPSYMVQTIAKLENKNVNNVSIKDISEFHKKYGPFLEWEKKLSRSIDLYDKGKLPGLDEKGYNQYKTLIEAFKKTNPLEGSRFDLSKNKKGFLQVGKVDNELVNEARKYKSAEEFVKAQGKPVYHGSKDKIVEFKSGFEGTNEANEVSKQGIFFVNDRKIAKRYGEGASQEVGGGAVSEAYLYPKKEFTIDYRFKTQLFENIAGMLKQAKDRGYDLVTIKGWNDGIGGVQRVVLDPKIIKTKTQLSEIYKSSK